MNLLSINFKKFASDRRGATAIEYGLIGAMITVVIIAALGSTGLNLGELYTLAFGEISGNVEQANNGGT